MNFDFEPEQHEFAGSIAKMLRARATPVRHRELWETATGRDAEVWQGLADAGVLSILVPEAHGGLGGDITDLTLVLEEAGRTLVPDAVIESAVVVPLALAGASPDVAGRWLPGIADGTTHGVAALAGTPFVPDAHIADIVLLEHDDGLFLYQPEQLVLTRVTSMDPSRRIFRAEPREAGIPLGLDHAAIVRVHAHQDAALAIVVNGIAKELLQRTVDYVKVREQFGRTLGSFQAVKHQLAQAHSRNELARRAAWSAAYRLGRGSEDAVDAAVLALVCATEAEFESNRVALQLHGGIGFTWEFDLQQWLKRGKVLEQAYGGRQGLLMRAGRAGIVTGSSAVSAAAV